jgi:hypothetical protein
MTGASMYIQCAFDSERSNRPGIEILWERIPASLAELPELAVEEIDLRSYPVETFEVEDMIATAGPGIWS